MICYRVISLLALVTASTAGPISIARLSRRDSSLFPTPPPACLAKANSTALSASNTTSGANTTSLTDTSNSNVTGSTNTTTTMACVVSASDLQGLLSSMNGTDLSNAASAYNCTNQTNSTSSDPTSSSDNSTTTTSADSSTDIGSGGNSTDNSADIGSGDNSTDASSTDSSSTDTNSTDTATAVASTSNSTSDSSAPPASTAPPSGSSAANDGSSGIFDPSTGEFTANTSDPSGRRKRSLPRVVLHSILPRLKHKFLSNHRRLAQTDLPAVAQNWQDLCLASGGDIFTSQPCVNLAGVGGINALLSTAGVCDQQDNADKMIDFAKLPGVTNQDALIAAAIAYRKHPRNAEDVGRGVIPSVPYCTKQPRNQELVGVVNGQLPGVNPGLYGGPNSPVVAFGADGTCPAGQTPDASTCSCA